MAGSDCIFCKIAAHELPAYILCEDAHGLAIMDINPAAPGHVLVISKVHAPNVFTIPADALAQLMPMVQKVARAVDAVLAPDGVSLVQANGSGAAQTVMHFHMHVVPRHFEDHLPLNWRATPGSRKEIEQIAGRLRSALGGG